MAAIVEELRRIPMSQRLAETLATAAEVAHAQHHAEVSLEHLLLTLSDDHDAAQVLGASHVDDALLKADVSQFLAGLPATAHAAPVEQLQIAPDLRRILEAAAAAAAQGRRREINGAIVLAAIVGDGKSSAAHMLRSQGLTFEAAIRALQRALAQAAAPVANAEDVLATARERVQNRSMPGMPPRPVVETSARVDAVSSAQPVQPEVAVAPSNPKLSTDEFRSAIVTELQDVPPPDVPSGAIQPPTGHADHGDPDAFAAHVVQAPPPLETVPWPEETTVPPQPPVDAPAMFDGGAFGRGVPDPSAMTSPTDDQPVAALHFPPPLPMPRERPSIPSAGVSRWPAPVGPAWQQTEVAERSFQGPPPISDQPIADQGAFGGASLPPPPFAPGDACQQADPGWPEPPLQPSWQSEQGWQADPGSGTVTPPPLPPIAAEQNFANAGGGEFGLHRADENFQSYGGVSDPFGPQPPHVGGTFDGHGADPRLAYPSPQAGYGSGSDGNGAGFVPTTAPAIAADPVATAAPPANPSRDAVVPVPLGHGREVEPTTGGRRVPIDKVVAGQLVENVPRRMRTYVPSDVTVRLANADAQRLIDGLGEGVYSHAVRVAPAMSVKLRAPDGGFIIDGSSRETQWIESGITAERDFAQWRWTVTPKRSGRQRLQLLISARTVDQSGLAADTMLPDQIVEIAVAANYGRALLRVATWAGIAVAGGLAARFGDRIYEPVVAQVMTLIR